MRLIANPSRCRAFLPGAVLLRRLVETEAGSAAIEFALVGLMLVLLLLNLVDFSRMIWTQMEVDNSAEIGAQAAYNACAGQSMPATTHCSSLDSAVATAVRSTSLGAAVSLAAGSPGEAYYCPSGTSLQSVGAYSSPPTPFDCSATGDSSTSPGDYVTVNVTYNFAPLFSGLSLAPRKAVTGTAITRLR